MAFVKEKSFKTTFEGAEVTAKLSPLEFGDWLDIRGGTTNLDMVRRCVELLPKYASGLHGVLDAEGKEVTIETICKYSYFQELVGELAREVLRSGNLENPSTPAALSGG